MSTPGPHPVRSTPTPSYSAPGKSRLGKFLLVAVVSIACLYVLGVGAAYVWLHFVRNSDSIGVMDVALFRVQQVRHEMAEQQFSQASSDLEKKNFRAAFLSYTSALRRDPDNIPGRLKAAAFFASIGSIKMQITVLEEGLVRAPDNLTLADKTLGLLTSTSRDKAALDLIHRIYGDRASGDVAPTVETYRILATLDLGKTAEGRKLFDQHPEIRDSQVPALTLANVLWKSGERLKAIDSLTKYTSSGTAAYPAYAQLAKWQSEGGMNDDAVATVRAATVRFPDEIAARVLLLDMLATRSETDPAVQAAIEAYISDTKGQPAAIAALEELAGRKGWVNLARNLYLVTADRRVDLRMSALYLSDALSEKSRSIEQQIVLSQLESQTDDASAAYSVQLRQREVMSAAARGDLDAEREDARYLAAAVLKNDPDSLDTYRRLFTELGLKDAAAAFPNP